MALTRSTRVRFTQARERAKELSWSLRGSRVRRSVVYARLTGAQARLTVQDAYPTRIQRIQPYPGVSGSIGDRIYWSTIRHVSRYATWRIGYVSEAYRTRIRIRYAYGTGTEPWDEYRSNIAFKSSLYIIYCTCTQGQCSFLFFSFLFFLQITNLNYILK